MSNVRTPEVSGEPLIQDIVDEQYLLALRGHQLELAANSFPLIMRSLIYVISLCTVVFVMPISPVAASKMNIFKCSLIQCLIRNLNGIWKFLDRIGILGVFRNAGRDLVPHSPKQALTIMVKLYLAMVLSIWIYRCVKPAKKKTKQETA